MARARDCNARIDKDIFGITVSLSPEDMNRLRQRLHDFKNLIYHEFRDKKETPGKDVYQLGMRFFALTDIEEVRDEAE